MKTFSDVYKHLRRKNRKQYTLLFGCLFFSVLLISSYISMMRSPTILSVLPEGGDSRKQMMMIFVLTAIGCAVFSLYAATLFFRQKSKDTGIFLALGVNRKLLARQVLKEMCLLSALSCISGIILSIPFTRGIWTIFRLLVVDTEEMVLFLEPQAFLFSMVFSLCVLAMLLFTGARSVRKIDIIDIIHESHRSEPIHEVPRKYGWVGILLVLLGIFMGYQAPMFFLSVLNWLPPEGLTAIFYLPALIGLYMILLHTVVNGWGRKKTSLPNKILPSRRGLYSGNTAGYKYKDLVANSQMKFQGRQTVQNLLIMSVLIAGAYYASFYTPITRTGAVMEYNARPVDYVYHFRMDQDIPREPEVRKLAAEYQVEITDWTDIPAIRLGIDGMEELMVEQAVGMTQENRYQEVYISNLFLPESAYTELTGETLGLPSRTLAAVFGSEGSKEDAFDRNTSLLTNTLSGQRLVVRDIVPLRNAALSGYYVMNDQDFISMGNGLTDEWKEMFCLFNVKDCEHSYDFAKALFYDIVDHSDQKVEIVDFWDPVRKEIEEEREGSYFADPEHLEEYGFSKIDYRERDSSAFRMFWQYMPSFRILDQMDSLKTMAVFLMLFVFISIVCFAAVFVIAFTRTMTIALSGKGMYEDLRRLGASNRYLYRTVRSQAKRVFVTPAVVGMSIIYLFFVMILYFNDGRISEPELAGMGGCILVSLAVSGIYYGVYRVTINKVCEVLDISYGKMQGTNYS